MDQMLIIPVSLIGSAGVALVVLHRKLFRPERMLPVSTDWIQELGANRYQPMGRLLGGADEEFLASHPGCSRSMRKRVGRERRRIFRGYLSSLREDFCRACTMLEIMMTQSAEDRPDLAVVLLQQRARFYAGTIEVEVRLLLDACGWEEVLDARTLSEPLEVLGEELRRIVLPWGRVTAAGA